MKWKMTREFYIPKGAKKIKLQPYKDLGLEVYVSDWKPGDGLVAMGFHGKAQKPDFYVRFRNKKDQMKKIDQFVQSRINHLEDLKKRKEARKEPHTFPVGTIFYNSWGYDQTNVDFYQVESVTKHTVKLRAIGKSTESESGNYNYVLPVPDSFYGESFVKKVNSGSKFPFVSMNSYSVAVPWDGETPLLETSPYAGH